MKSWKKNKRQRKAIRNKHLVTVDIVVPLETKRDLIALSRRLNVSVSSLITEALREAIKKCKSIIEEGEA